MSSPYDDFADSWLLCNLESTVLQAGVMDVWTSMPEEDRQILRAMHVVVVERELSRHLGWHTIQNVRGEERRIIALDGRIDSFRLAAQVFAHEAAHVILRHLECGLNGFEQVEDFAESQADWLATRWGFPPPARQNGHH